MTTRCSLLTSLLLTVCVLAASACDADDEACAAGTCEREEPDQATEPTSPESPPVPCLPACEALTGSCDSDARGDTTDIRAVAACIDWCEAGGLTADEVACLESVTCERADGCLGG
jgi:hypothetical protein